MSEMTQQKQVTILLAVVAVLLVAIIGIIIYQQTAIPEPTVSGTANTMSAEAPSESAFGMPPANAQPAAHQPRSTRQLRHRFRRIRRQSSMSPSITSMPGRQLRSCLPDASDGHSGQQLR